MKKKTTIKAPLTHNPGKGRPKEHLAYLNWQEMEALKRLNGNNMERGPRGLPSFADDSASSKGVSRPATTTTTTRSSGPSTSLSAPARTAPSTGTVSRTTTTTTRSSGPSSSLSAPARTASSSGSLSGIGGSSSGPRGPTGPSSSQPRTSPLGGSPGAIARSPSGTGAGGSRGPTGPSGQARTSPAGGIPGAVSRSPTRDTSALQTAATRDARSVTQNRAFQQDAGKSGVKSINVGPMGTPVNVSGPSVSTRVKGAISAVQEQAKYPSRGATAEPPKATTDINAMTMSARKAIGTPDTNPNYARDYAKINAERDAQIRRLTAPTPQSLATVNAGFSYVNPNMSESMKKLLASKGYNPDGTKIQGPTPAQMAAMYGAYRSPPSIPQFAGRPAPSVPAPAAALDPSIAGRLAEANKNYTTVSNGPYATRVYSDPDIQRGPTIGDTVSGYARSMYDKMAGGIGNFFNGSVNDIPAAMRTPLDGFKVPGLTYENPSYPNINYKGLADYMAGDAAMRRAIMDTPGTDMYGFNTEDSFINSGVMGTTDALQNGTAAMYPTSPRAAKLYTDRPPVAPQTPVEKVLPFRNGVPQDSGLDLNRTMDLGTQAASAVTMTDILNKANAVDEGVPKSFAKLIMDRVVTPYSGQMSPYTVNGNETTIRQMSPVERILAVENVPPEPKPGFSRITNPYSVGMTNLFPGMVETIREAGYGLAGKKDPRLPNMNPAQETASPSQDATISPEAEKAQEKDRKAAKRVKGGLGALNLVAPGAGTLARAVFGGLDGGLQKLVDRYQDASIADRAIMEQKYPNLIPRARAMGIQTGNDAATADALYRAWADKTRFPETSRGNSGSSNNLYSSGSSGASSSAVGGSGGGSSGGSGSGSSTSGGDSGRPYIYYQWDLGVNIPSPGDSNYTLYQKYLAERAAAEAAMYG